MDARCCATWPNGRRCESAGVVYDAVRGGSVCLTHAPPGRLQRQAQRIAIRRAMLQPDRFLAATLAELTDEAVAISVGCLPGEVWALRLAGWPRADKWQQDVLNMARAIGADPELLARLLRRVAEGNGSDWSRLS